MTVLKSMRRPAVPILLVLLLWLAGCGGFANGPWPGFEERSDVPPGTAILRDLEYARVDGRSLKLDLYLPPAGGDPAPLIVWIHGGAWKAGSKSRCRAQYLTGEGFAVAAIEYRLSQEATFPAQIHDCKAAIRFLRARAAELGIDPGRIGVWGGSAGGHLAALLGTTGDLPELEGRVGDHLDRSSRVQAVVDFCGPSMLVTEQLAHVRAERAGQAKHAVEALLGGDPQEREDLARLASPALHASPDDAPFLIVHGREDPLVPLQQSEILADALRRAGVPVRMDVLEGQGHGIPLTDEIRGLVAEFFRSCLQPAISAPATVSGPCP